MDRPCYICYNPHTGERRLLIESEAFKLDVRAWIKSVWNCTSGHEREMTKTRAPEPLNIASAQFVERCWRCGSHHFDEPKTCKRSQYKAFGEK